MNDKELRELVFGLANGWCEYPQCGDRADELAHLTSKGMGGSKYRNTVDNGMAACRSHARVTDGLPPIGGGLYERNHEYYKVPGVTLDDIGKTRLVIEKLRTNVLAERQKREWLKTGSLKLGTFDPTDVRGF